MISTTGYVSVNPNNSIFQLHPTTPCPACGHCPTCGRGGHQYAPYVPYVPNGPWVAPNTYPYHPGGMAPIVSGQSADSSRA